MKLLDAEQKRQLVRVLGVYVAGGWVVTEAFIYVSGVIGIAEWPGRVVVITWVFGFPFVCVLTWLFASETLSLRLSPFSIVSSALIVGSLSIVVVSAYLFAERGTRNLSGSDQPVLAVLPFRVSDELPENLGEGFSEDVIAFLDRYSEVTVRAPYSSFLLTRQGLAGVEAGRQLDADLVIEGSMREAGDRIYVNARLIDVATEQVLWSSVDDYDPVNILQARLALAENVASETSGVLSGVPTDTPRVVPEAWRKLNEALAIRRSSDFQRAPEIIDLLKEVTILDPELAAGHSYLGEAYATIVWTTEDRNSPLLELARSHVVRALHLDPGQPHALATLGVIEQLSQNWSAARRAADQALASAPMSSAHLTGPVFVILGHLQKRKQVMEDAYRADPLNPEAAGGLASAFSLLGDLEKTVYYSRIEIELGSAGGERGGEALMRLGRIEEGKTMFARAIKRWGMPEEFSTLVAGVLTRTVDKAELRADIDRFVAQGLIGPPEQAWLTAELGDYDRFYELANELYLNGQLNPIQFYDQSIKGLRGHPGFLPLMEKIGLADYWREVEPPDFCQLISGKLHCI